MAGSAGRGRGGLKDMRAAVFNNKSRFNPSGTYDPNFSYSVSGPTYGSGAVEGVNACIAEAGLPLPPPSPMIKEIERAPAMTDSEVAPARKASEKIE